MEDRLVGKQMRRWEINERIRKRFERDETKCPPPSHVITVSRQWGSGGTNIAKLVAKQLDFKLYDKEIINRVAELSGVQPEQIEHHDERDPDLVSDLVLQLLEGRHPTGGSYLRALVRTMRQIARNGKAVILGRAATCILPDSFRVRIIAPQQIRIARLSELHDLDLKTARRMVLETDRQRFQFVRSQFGCDPDDSMQYDLIINTEHLSIDHAADILIRGFRNRWEAVEAAC